ncbi:MAG: hypothetical protein CYPHOPRED_001924 [Cyphobasidiales sp. Tagirdzhanova-0007]|nr:MAG: hypothetical protein CYPHOPRED_001924 [Cyphobasidiales sp. Tagirdzhanova-0007]
MAFGDEHEKAHRAKAGKILSEAKKLAGDYQKTLEGLLLKQEQELETVYTAYVQSNTRDLEERKQILLQLGRNYEQIEYLRKTLFDRSTAIEAQRYEQTIKYFKSAEKEASAGNGAVIHSVLDKKTVINQSQQNSRRLLSASGTKS